MHLSAGGAIRDGFPNGSEGWASALAGDGRRRNGAGGAEACRWFGRRTARTRQPPLRGLLLLRRIQFDQFLPIGLRRRCPPAARWVVGERCMLPAVGARFVPRGVAAIEIFVP